MEYIMKIAGIGIAASVVALLIKKDSPASALMISLGVTLAVLAFGLSVFADIKKLLDQLTGLSGLSPAVISPLLKATGIAIVSKIGREVCLDAEQKAAAAGIEMAGALLAVYVSLPLISAVLSLVQSMG